MKLTIYILLVLGICLVNAGCTTVTFPAFRSNFSGSDNIAAGCRVYSANPSELNRMVKEGAEKGWRVAAIGKASTTFLIFSSHEIVVCYEKLIQ